MNTNLPLSPRQERAAVLIASGQSITAVAGVLGVTRETVSRWGQRPEFKAAVNAAKEEQLEITRNILRAAGEKAIAQVVTLVDSEDPATALKASLAILDRLDPFNPEAGGAASYVGSTDPDDFRTRNVLGVDVRETETRTTRVMQILERILSQVAAEELEPEKVGLPFGIDFPMDMEEIILALEDVEDLEAWAVTLEGALDEADQAAKAKAAKKTAQAAANATKQGHPKSSVGPHGTEPWTSRWKGLNDAQVAGYLKRLLAFYAEGDLTLADVNAALPPLCRMSTLPPEDAQAMATFDRGAFEGMLGALQDEIARANSAGNANARM